MISKACLAHQYVLPWTQYCNKDYYLEVPAALIRRKGSDLAGIGFTGYAKLRPVRVTRMG